MVKARRTNQPSDEETASGLESGDENVRHRVRLPGFLISKPVGLGRVVKRITSAAGLKPCNQCDQRATRLDRWMRIEPRR
jgi:hypothetical protein